jgi:hypothetical protein
MDWRVCIAWHVANMRGPRDVLRTLTRSEWILPEYYSLVGQANPTESTVVRTAAALLVFYFSLVRTPLFCSAVGLRPPGARGVRQRRLAAVGRSSPLLLVCPPWRGQPPFRLGSSAPRLPAPKGTLSLLSGSLPSFRLRHLFDGTARPQKKKELCFVL